MTARTLFCGAFLVVLLAFTASAGTAPATTYNTRLRVATCLSTPDTTSFRVRVGVDDKVFFGTTVDLPIYLDTAAYPLGGFDLLLGYDNSELTLKSVTADDSTGFLSLCHWEYFTYRAAALSPAIYQATNTVRLVAIADINNGDAHPTCRVPQNFPAMLASLRFTATNNMYYNCTFFPVSFLWTNCTDNLFVDSTGKNVFISSAVIDIMKNHIEANDTFPTFHGAPDSCLSYTWTGETITQSVSFQNGGVEVICDGTVDVTGDINLNGLAFEISDYDLYRDYFLNGLSVFAHPAGSSAASDVNGDGKTLTVADLLEMVRVILGDALPDDPFVHSLNDAHVLYDQSTGLVKIDTPDTLGAISLEFAGCADSVTSDVSFADELQWNCAGGLTRVLVAPSLSNNPSDPEHLDSIVNAELHVYPPLALVHADVTTYDAKVVTTIVENPTAVDESGNGNLPSTFVCHQNYPNPFNLSTTISFELPAPSTVRLEIVNQIGQIVHTISGFYSAGAHTVSWDGKTEGRQVVSSGIYYAKLTAGSNSAVKKMVLLK